MVYSLLEEALKEYILYGAPILVFVENNLVTIKANSYVINLDFFNGKVENVWFNGSLIPLSIEEKYDITILTMVL